VLCQHIHPLSLLSYQSGFVEKGDHEIKVKNILVVVVVVGGGGVGGGGGANF